MSSNKDKQELLNFTRGFDLKQLIEGPTRTSRTCWSLIGLIHLKFHENAGFNDVFKFNVITQTTTEHILDVETKRIRKMRSGEPFRLNKVDPCALHTGIPT